ncbi:CCAAT/enhancer-binding protein zeta [Bacillus rossius redtenbacheri]|uniref:CCAAT/enhancer-binding protein zeta n=1 Tax=Bacillus rossius redtenbacheri TaxID=93214 RepID=UPI002FDE2125
MVKLQKKQQKGFVKDEDDLSQIIDDVDDDDETNEQLYLQPQDETNAEFSAKKKWYEEFVDEPSEAVSLSLEEIERLRAEAKKLLADEVTKHEHHLAETRSDHQWMRTVLARGTASDKVAALTLLVQDSPLHGLSSLESLVAMARVAKKRECVLAIDALTDLFLTELLPPDRRLRPFEACPLDGSDPARLLRHLLEDRLKASYLGFVGALAAAARDSVDANREKAVVAMYKLLSGRPEQEALLLRHLVNKLGDPNSKTVSKVIYCLGQLLRAHPNMKGVVMEEIEKLLFRPNMGDRAQYYCICFLSQFVFTDHDAVVARNLISLYFSFFKACIKKGEVDSRMMSALLMGVNRAYPFAKAEMRQITEHVQTMYKVVHMAGFNVALHTLCLLYHVCDHANSMSDRFYSALYRKMVDPGLMTSCHQAMFLSLVFRSLRRDTHAGRIRAFVKRLLQVCTYSPVPLACGILYMASQLVYRRSDLLALTCKASFVDDCDDDGEEHYYDVKLEEGPRAGKDEQGAGADAETEAKSAEAEAKNAATWQHSDNMRARGSRYCPLQRNPSFAGAEHSAYLELLALSRHFHPTVALFASNIIEGKLTSYSGDPLLDFTVARFLDRFVFKNPKKVNREDVPVHPFDRKKTYVASGARALRVNTSSYLSMEEWSIPEDERFLYRYLYARQSKTAKDEEDSDADSVASDEFEEMMDKLSGSKNAEESLDFADHISTQTASGVKKGKKKSGEAGSDEESAEDDDEDDFDGGSGDDAGSMADDASDIVFDSDDNASEGDIINELKELQFGSEDLPQSSRKTKGKGKKGVDMRSMFASADEFAEILQDEGVSGHTGQFSNKDNAGVKQLKWESKRDFWLNRSDKKRRTKGPGGKAKKQRRK